MPAHMTARGYPKPRKTAQQLRDARKRLKAVQLKANAVRVRERDGDRCRCCGSTDLVQVHHIRFRSRGGDDSTGNLVCLCVYCHGAVHEHQVTITGDADGVLNFRWAA